MPVPSRHSLIKALRSVPDFASLDENALLQIVGASANLFWRAGSLIFEEGSEGEALFIVLSGRVRIFDTEGGKHDVAHVEPGDYFGELSLLLEATHTKGAEAEEDTELMVLPKDSFRRLLAARPALVEHFKRRLAEHVPDGEIALITH